MNDVFDIIKVMAEDGYTWQETIILGIALIGLTLSVPVVVRGAVSLTSLFLRTIERAIEKIHIPEKTEAKNDD
jgi:hypothetical protein